LTRAAEKVDVTKGGARGCASVVVPALSPSWLGRATCDGGMAVDEENIALNS